MIDELRVYNRALSPTEVKTLYQQGQPTNVVLFLHGMNSNPGTWNDMVSKYFANGNCPSIYDGKINATAKANAQSTYCYRVKFGAFDADSPNKGLEEAWDYGETNGYGSAGDYSTFNQLGLEVNRAVAAIKANKTLFNPRILLIAHSRGGLAARAFLQNPVYLQNQEHVAGLITTGTPHNGTRMGRIYNYIDDFLLSANGERLTAGFFLDDWQVVDFLNGTEGLAGFKLDARRPVIGYLADNSPEIAELTQYQANSPAIKYGAIAYTNVWFGDLDPLYKLFGVDGALTPTLSIPAKGYIATGGEPVKSKVYKGDGIVTTASQLALPKVTKTRSYKPFFSVRHTDEPKQTADIDDMMCRLNFDWVHGCVSAAQPVLKQSAAPFKPAEAVSHDYDTLLAGKLKPLWQDWLATITDDTQANQREQLAVALGIKLRASDNAALYADINQRLLDVNASAPERARLAHLLAEIATPSALGVLVEAYINHDWQPSKDCQSCATALSNAIKTVADSLPEQPRRADLSAVLEAAWLQPRLSQPQLITLAESIAKLGTPRGVEWLLAAVEKNGAVLPSTQKKALSRTEKQALAAFLAMGEVINPDSETVLATAFMSHRADEAVFVAAGHGLVNLGSDSAAQQVLQRVDELPVADLPIGRRWLGKLSGKIDKASLRRINKAVGLPKQPALKLQMEEMVR